MVVDDREGFAACVGSSWSLGLEVESCKLFWDWIFLFGFFRHCKKMQVTHGYCSFIYEHSCIGKLLCCCVLFMGDLIALGLCRLETICDANTQISTS